MQRERPAARCSKTLRHTSSFGTPRRIAYSIITSKSYDWFRPLRIEPELMAHANQSSIASPVMICGAVATPSFTPRY